MIVTVMVSYFPFSFHLAKSQIMVNITHQKDATLKFVIFPKLHADTQGINSHSGIVQNLISS